VKHSPVSDPVVVCAATLDTKGHEAAYLCQLLKGWGIAAILVDLSTQNPPQVAPDVAAETVLSALQNSSLKEVNDLPRGEAVAKMAQAFQAFIADLHRGGKLLGVIGIGGSGGTSLVSGAMRALPIGLPKVLVSTLASGNTVPIIGTSDILLLYPVVDVAGLNRVSRIIFQRAAAAMAGMVSHPPKEASESKRTVGLTMFGVTTPCVEAVRKTLEAKGFECLVFHATGTGGKAMETLVSSGLIDAVLDITTTEVADEIAGGIFPSGPDRMDAILAKKIPYLVSAGAMDMVNFGAIETVPEKYRKRKLHLHNSLITLMRTTPDENRLAGAWIGRKLAKSPGNWQVLLPEKGVSALDAPGKPFEDPAANEAFFDSLEKELTRWPEKVKRVPLHVNDPAFAAEIVRQLEELMQQKDQGARK